MMVFAESGGSREMMRLKCDSLRLCYKKMEWAIEYFLPHSARFMNGPAVPEIEYSEHTVLEPEGLQVLEEYIYGEYNREEVVRQLKKLLSKGGTVETNFQTITINRTQVADALRQEIFRVSSLGLAGFDTAVSGNNLAEMAVALQSLKPVYKLLESKKGSSSDIVKAIDGAVKKLSRAHSRTDFDYASFMSQDLNAISTAAYHFLVAEQIPAVQVTSTLSKTTRTLYDESAFDVDAFVPGDSFTISKEKVLLGGQLFYDPQLSQKTAAAAQPAITRIRPLPTGYRGPVL